MRLSALFYAFAILAVSVLLVATIIFRPAMLIYVIGVFAPCGAVAALESSGRRFVSLGGATMTFAAAGPVMLVGLLDATRNPVGDALAWIVPMAAGVVGFAVSYGLPLVTQAMQARSQVDNFTQLQVRQDELRAAWGEALDDQPPGS
jgi:hypothetical protein